MSEHASQSAFRLEDFEYELPEELIAQEPPAVRHASRLMSVQRAAARLEHHQFAELPELLQPGDLLVVNDTKVIPARLHAQRMTGGHVEILLLRPEAARPGVWLAMATPLRKLKVGEPLALLGCGQSTVTVAGIVAAEDGQKRVLIDFGGQAHVYSVLSESGAAPLPPYIRRRHDAEDFGERRLNDLRRYQTIFAQAPGAVAAPTAGLHFSEEIFARLEKRGVEVKKLTLHVGPGTFKPIVSTVDEHTIEPERYSISEETAASVNSALAERRRIIAVGTTSCRALEAAGASGLVQPVNDAATNLYIRPGYNFKVISGLVTNFHLSKSSLLVLVAAFAGHELIMAAYQQAVSAGYRFFSYGDAMLIV